MSHPAKRSGALPVQPATAAAERGEDTPSRNTVRAYSRTELIRRLLREKGALEFPSLYSLLQDVEPGLTRQALRNSLYKLRTWGHVVADKAPGRLTEYSISAGAPAAAGQWMAKAIRVGGYELYQINSGGLITHDRRSGQMMLLPEPVVRRIVELFDV